MNSDVGIAVLEDMESAHNYNAALSRLIQKYAKSGTVLDYGAGTGNLSKLSDLSPICLETDHDLVKTLQQKGLRLTDNIEPETYDYIYSVNVLEHIEDDQQAILNMLNGLKQGGRLLIYVPAFNNLFSDFDRQLNHFRRYDRHSLRRLFDNQGVDVLQLRYFDTIGYFVALLFKLLNCNGRRVNQQSIKLFDRFIFPFNKLLDPVCSRLLGKNLFIVVDKQK